MKKKLANLCAFEELRYMSSEMMEEASVSDISNDITDRTPGPLPRAIKEKRRQLEVQTNFIFFDSNCQKSRVAFP